MVNSATEPHCGTNTARRFRQRDGQDTLGDMLARSFSILMLAVPSFWLGTMVVVFPSIWWGWSPEVNYVKITDNPLQNLKQMSVPAIVLGLGLSAVIMRMTRTMMLEVLRQDYVRTAWAKGLPERLVVMRHALRNALIPVVTLIGLQAPLLIGCAIVIEQIFVIPGMGLLLLEAVSQRDYPVVTGVFLVVGLTVMLINLVVDLSYGDDGSFAACRFRTAWRNCWFRCAPVSGKTVRRSRRPCLPAVRCVRRFR